MCLSTVQLLFIYFVMNLVLHWKDRTRITAWLHSLVGRTFVTFTNLTYVDVDPTGITEVRALNLFEALDSFKASFFSSVGELTVRKVFMLTKRLPFLKV